jgi:hypothetical protein
MGYVVQAECDLCNYKEEFFIGQGMRTKTSTGLYYSDTALILLDEFDKESANYEKLDMLGRIGVLGRRNQEKVKCPNCKNISLEIINVGMWD